MASDSGSRAIALLLSILLHFNHTALGAATPPYTPTDYILLDCGSNSTSTSLDGRLWKADTLSNIITLNTLTISQVPSPSVPHIPYVTARIFLSESTYTFPSLSPGPKFLRLYFYPPTYIPNRTPPFFSVIANQNTLLTLSNFSAFLTVSSNNLIKEYIIHINDTYRQLDITFMPTSGSFAFINGIEIVSMPKDLYFKGDNVPLGTSSIDPFYLKSDKALETLYRLNVGGVYVPATNDTGMFRTWSPDDDYVLGFGFTTGLIAYVNAEVNYTLSDPAYTAPEIVYTSARNMDDKYSRLYNMTWVFPVDSGFYYLLRLHFCEFFLSIRKPGDRVFSIFIDNQTVEYEADVISWGTGRKNEAVFRDYVAFITDPDGQENKKDLWLSVSPPRTEVSTAYDSALLNGLEIFKISGSNGSLNSPNPDSAFGTNKRLPAKKIKRRLVIIFITTAGIVALVVIFLGIFIWKRRKTMNDSDTSNGNHRLPLIGNCRHFSFDEMKRTTCNFDENFVIGVGGFGSVYRGCIDNNLSEVAIKRLNPTSNQGISEFQTEIEMLSKLRHLHLVSLIGYCYEKGEMILVYDYMSRGTLRDHLYNTKNPHLPWRQRLQICVAVARGLHYLHTGSGHTIIHRDIKSTNILLDENWVAKVSDFGLSKIGPINGSKYHVSTMVKGSFGYLDPEYFLTQRLTDKSDVYSFGVVLLEVLCALPAITRDLSGERINLVDWAHLFNKDGTLGQIIDPLLKGEIASNCLAKYVEITFKCLNRKGALRPAMSDVVWNLEFALQLQEDDEKSLSSKVVMESFDAGPSVLIDQQGMVEPDNSNSGFTNYSVTWQSY